MKPTFLRCTPGLAGAALMAVSAVAGLSATPTVAMAQTQADFAYQAPVTLA